MRHAKPSTVRRLAWLQHCNTPGMSNICVKLYQWLKSNLCTKINICTWFSWLYKLPLLLWLDNGSYYLGPTVTQKFNNIENLYSFEYTDHSQAFFAKNHLRRSWNKSSGSHCCILHHYVIPDHSCALCQSCDKIPNDCGVSIMLLEGWQHYTCQNTTNKTIYKSMWVTFSTRCSGTKFGVS